MEEDNPTSIMKKLLLILIVSITAACGEIKSPQEHLEDHVRSTLDSARKELSTYEAESLGKVDSVLTAIETDSTITKTRSLLKGVSGLVDEVTGSGE